jgi:hypothetical protein
MCAEFVQKSGRDVEENPAQIVRQINQEINRFNIVLFSKNSIIILYC